MRQRWGLAIPYPQQRLHPLETEIRPSRSWVFKAIGIYCAEAMTAKVNSFDAAFLALSRYDTPSGDGGRCFTKIRSGITYHNFPRLR